MAIDDFFCNLSSDEAKRATHWHRRLKPIDREIVLDTLRALNTLPLRFGFDCASAYQAAFIAFGSSTSDFDTDRSPEYSNINIMAIPQHPSCKFWDNGSITEVAFFNKLASDHLPWDAQIAPKMFYCPTTACEPRSRSSQLFVHFFDRFASDKLYLSRGGKIDFTYPSFFTNAEDVIARNTTTSVLLSRQYPLPHVR